MGRRSMPGRKRRWFRGGLGLNKAVVFIGLGDAQLKGNLTAEAHICGPCWHSQEGSQGLYRRL